MSTIESIDLHVRTYRSALKSTREVSINSLVNSYQLMESSLHPNVNSAQIDVSALIYSLLRLPSQIDHTKIIVAGQTPEVFANAGFTDVVSWPEVKTKARRRTTHFDQKTSTMAMFISSVSDIDDFVNMLISFQIEWNKIHQLLKDKFNSYPALLKQIKDPETFCQVMELTKPDCLKIKQALGPDWQDRLKKVYSVKKNFRIRLLAGSWIDYIKTSQKWWKNIAKFTDASPLIPKSTPIHMSRQSIYFISSNTHSLSNLVNGYPLKHQKEILSYTKTKLPDLYLTWQKILSKESFIHSNDFLYYASQFFPVDKPDKQKLENSNLFLNIESSHYLDINTQIIPVKNLVKSKYLDNRLTIKKPKKLSSSNALVFNIDYPLGFTAYNLLKEILSNITEVKGIYIMGKAATLNSQIGDIQIPRVVFDEHTQNSYMFTNCFNKFFPFTSANASILTEQKAVSVLGTYLQNQALIDKYSQNNLTVVEMESGPYLGVVTEATYDSPVPKGTIVDLNSAPFDLGIINYTSDTPFAQTKTLGHLGLSLTGIEPVYLSSLAILQRIIYLEENN